MTGLFISTALISSLMMFLGYIIPFYLYSKSVKVIARSFFITIINFQKNKKEIAINKQKDLNDFAVIFFNDLSKRIDEKKSRDIIKTIYIKKAKNNEYFNYKATKKYIRNYERYDYTFSKMFKINIKLVTKELRENKVSLNPSISFEVNKLINKVNKKMTKSNVDSILSNSCSLAS